VGIVRVFAGLTRRIGHAGSSRPGLTAPGGSLIEAAMPFHDIRAEAGRSPAP
jgi:hypothetical protein